jgi:hypothetical protein
MSMIVIAVPRPIGKIPQHAQDVLVFKEHGA